MKKKSRFLTGLLSAVMALSLCALPVSAAGDNANIVSTIDTNRKGTLTIEKHEGEDATDDNLLNGVTFKIYKVASIDQTNQNGVIETKITPVQALTNKKSDISIDFDTKYSAISATVDAAVADGSLTPVATKKTGADTDIQNATGKVKFVNLEVGIYLVVEADAPAQIVNKSANFLVSIPMVNTERTGWNYEITAQPKNTAVYGGVTLYKYGKTAGDTGKGTALSGAKFILQQQSVNNNWSKVTDFSKLTINNSKDTTAENGVLTTNAEGMINIQGLAPGTYRFVEYSAPSEYITDGKTVYTFTIASDANGTTSAPAGASYWVAGAENVPGHIEVVNEKPDLTKQVKTSTDTFGKASDYKMGDTVTWKVETKIPSTIANLDTFTITDEMSKALDFTDVQQGKVVITTSPVVTLEKNTDYSFTPVAADADTAKGPSWTLTFTAAGKKKLADSNVTTVTVRFDTTLNDKAVTTDKGNLNDAKLEYSNAFYDNNVNQDHPENTGKETIKDQAVVYTFELNAVKMDGNDKATKLPGAEFTLYQYSGAVGSVTESDLKGTDGKKVFDLISDNDGQLVIKDEGAYKGKKPLLNKGTYYLVETKAPTANGKTYNLLNNPVEVKLNVVYEVESETKLEKDAQNNVTSITKTVKNTKFEDNSDKAGVFSVTIYNKQGFDLPVTGGFGTLLFSAIGALLVVGGVGVLMSTKKKKGNG